MRPVSVFSALAASRLPRSHGGDQLPRASQGQILVMFALMAGALFGILGLAVDVGYAVSQRRSIQNAADLAAIAGAHAIAEYQQDANEIDAYGAVSNVVVGNKTSEGTPTFTCSYINDDLWDLTTDCSGDVPDNATGVRVSVHQDVETFFMKIFGKMEVPIKATAAARVELLFRAGEDSPFIVCGYDAKLASGEVDEDDAVDGKMNILLDDTHVDPRAIGKTFRIVGDNVARPPADTDGDGLSDAKEVDLDTGSSAADDNDDGVPDGGDSDGDGVPDGLEVKSGTNPLVKDVLDLDADDDGLTDAEELALPKPTNPNDWDSDDDDLSDWAEVIVYSTDPTKDDPADDALRAADKDGDGLTDAAEGSPNKNKLDSDDGGTPDGLEVARGTNPDNGYERDDDWDTDSDGLKDNVDPYPYVWDGDGGGISDWAEGGNGTDATVTADDRGTGVDEISNCGVELLDAAGNVLEKPGDLNKRYNDSTPNRGATRAWFGFAESGRSKNNNDGRGTTPKNVQNPGGNEWNGRNGVSSSDPQRFTVDGVDGCYGSNQVGNPDGKPAADVDTFGTDPGANCILAIPVATKTTKPQCKVSPGTPGGPRCTFTVVKILSFKVARMNGGEYVAQLLDDYPTFGGSYPGWTRDSGGTVVIKLKE